MNKGLIMLMSGVVGTVGGYIPVLFGASGFGGWSILGAFVGGLVGIWVGYKIGDQ
jgi:hypothetical protein